MKLAIPDSGFLLYLRQVFQKLEKLIFYTLIFSIPLQTRMVLRSWGIGFSEWNSVFLYFTDLLILALLGLWLLRQLHFNDISLKVSWRKRIVLSGYDWFLIGFIVISAVSIINASNQALGFYQLLKLAELSLLYFYVKSNLGVFFPGSENSENNYMTAKPYSEFLLPGFVFIASGLFQAVLAILQYARQADLGLRFLGETVLSPGLFNVAIFMVEGEKVMRPYGTTPHPNVLALVIFVSIFLLYFLNFRSRLKNIVYGVLLFGLFLTFSRIIIFIWLIAFLFLFKKLDKKIIIATFFIAVLFLVLFWPQVLARLDISPQEEAVSLRGFYNKVSLFEKPFFGVGLGNFVNWFKEANPALAPNLYQPVHNIYLLIFSEIGVLGLAAFLSFIVFLIGDYLKLKFEKPFHYSFLIIFVSLLFFGLFDHFLWTLQQGQIIFWMTLGLISSLGLSKRTQ